MRKIITFLAVLMMSVPLFVFAGDHHVVSASVDHECLCSTSSSVTITLHLKGFSNHISIIWQYSAISDGKNWTTLTDTLQTLTTDSTGLYRAEVTDEKTSEKGTYSSPDIYIGECSTLPIALGPFDAKIVNGDQVQLNWSTYLEENSKEFDIQSSSDGISFATVAVVSAAKNSNITRLYGPLIVPLPEKSTVGFYRLMMVDIDGAVKFSKVVSVSIGSSQSKLIDVYPNPATTVIKFMDNKNGHKFVINNISGARVMSGTVSDMQISVASLVKGVYTISFDDGTSARFEK